MEAVVTSQEPIQSALTRIEDSYCVGDVIIAASAVIASGVVFRADPGCAITVRDGACIGADVIVHASSGAIELHQGVCVGGGVIITGSGFVGHRVCIGTGATIINPAIAADEIVPAQALVGDNSRPAEVTAPQSAESEGTNTSPPKHPVDTASQNGNAAFVGVDSPPDPWGDPSTSSSVAQGTQYGARSAAQKVESVYSWSTHETHQASEEVEVTTSTTVKNQAVIGKREFEKMVRKMFPDREAFKRSQINSQ